ncbi:MAG: glycosyltransferase family A protein [Gemmatimonadales bacterium]
MTVALSVAPRLSVVIATDTYDRIRLVIESLERQTMAAEIELIIVTTAPDEARAEAANEGAFYSVRIVETDSIVPLSRARAKGVLATSAPFIFIAETHAYPDPGLAERLVSALSGPWSLAVPGFRNSNPGNGLSWAGFLSDYGAWARGLPAGETDRAPSHDAAFRRNVLLEFGDRMENALTFGDELYLGLKARGHKAYFEPDAGIEHVNISRFGDFVGERFCSGVLIGGYRSTSWRWSKRIAYACATPLIAVVILSRVRKGVMEASRRENLPTGTFPALILGVLLKVAGEFRGYLTGVTHSAEERMTAYEVRKLAFNAGEEA